MAVGQAHDTPASSRRVQSSQHPPQIKYVPVGVYLFFEGSLARLVDATLLVFADAVPWVVPTVTDGAVQAVRCPDKRVVAFHVKTILHTAAVYSVLMTRSRIFTARMMPSSSVGTRG